MFILKQSADVLARVMGGQASRRPNGDSHPPKVYAVKSFAEVGHEVVKVMTSPIYAQFVEEIKSVEKVFSALFFYKL